MCISPATRFITSIGQGAPAMMPVRSEERSRRAKSRMLELGDEHRRHAVERRAALGFDRLEHGAGVERLATDRRCVAPRDVQPRLPITMPKQW